MEKSEMKCFGVMVLVFTGCLLGGLPPQESFGQTLEPGSQEPAGPRPSEILAKRVAKPHALNTATDVPQFLDWAGSTPVSERERVRKIIIEVSGNKEIATAFTKEADRLVKVDHSRALLALSILGEMKNPTATRFLVDFVNRPLPEKGTVTEDGEIIERTAMEMLQSKAIDGLAYMRNKDVDQEVLAVVARHPSKVVRAEAINALLWNHGDNVEYKQVLLKYVKKGDEIYLDRVRRVSGESSKEFNAKLQTFLRAHPEAVPPAPEKGKIKGKKEPGVKRDAVPPQF